MKISETRREICKVLRLIYERGLISGGDGNVSVRLRDQSLVLLTPKGRHKGLLSPEDLSLVSLDGCLISGPPSSSELHLHLEIYKKFSDVGAIVHAHPP